MLRLNVNEAKQLTFEVQIGGVHGENIESFFRIIFEDIEYGFPAKVGRESITVDLPPLTKVIGRKIKEGDEAEVKLQIVADGHYLTPWSDRAKLSNPLVIEAKIRDDNFVPNPTLQTRLVVSEDGAKQRTVVKEKEESDNDLTERIVERLSEKFADLIKPKVVEKKLAPVSECGKNPLKEEEDEDLPEPTSTQKVEENEPLSSGAMEKILSQTIQKLGLYMEGEKSTPKKKQPTFNEFKQNLKREDILKYIEKSGTKNPQIQEIIYEQAANTASSGQPIDILRQVIKIMKKKKS
jgi:hypothetical protein